MLNLILWIVKLIADVAGVITLFTGFHTITIACGIVLLLLTLYSYTVTPQNTRLLTFLAILGIGGAVIGLLFQLPLLVGATAFMCIGDLIQFAFGILLSAKQRNGEKQK